MVGVAAGAAGAAVAAGAAGAAYFPGWDTGLHDTSVSLVFIR